MKQSNPESIPGSARVFVACLLSFAILITPIAAIAAPRAGINPVLKEKAAPAERTEASNATVTSNLAPAPVPAPAPAAPVIVATMTDNRPSVDPASAKPGDTINYTVTIQNTGDADATTVQFNDDVDVHTAYVNGSGLLAMADSYNTIGDVQISVPAPGVLTNDLDISAGNNTGMTATAQTVSSAQCAACNNVTINADGSFTYDPKAGFTGTDSFTYTAKNAANKTANATVQIAVTGKIWFINNNAGACTSSCDGRLSHPFQTLAAFQAVNDGGANHPAAGDNIFIYESATSYVGPVTLLNNQKLIGQDATATLISLTGLTQPSGTDLLPAMNATPATAVTITSAANAIQIGNGNSNTLRGFTVGATTGAKIISTGATFGTLTVGNNSTPDVTLSGAGQALNLTSGAFAASSGFVSVATTSSGTQGINLSGITGAVSFGSTTVSGNSAQCILVGTTTADINFGNTSCTGGSDGVSLQNNANVGHLLTFGTLNVSGGTGNAFAHAVGGGNVTVTGAATLSSGNSAVSISAPTATDVINFQAATSATSTGAGNTGVNWIGTAGASLTFSALTIQTNAGTGLNATTGGSVTVTNGTGTINNTAQAAAAIIASSVTLNSNFSAIKSTGGTNGVSLTSVTGTSVFGSNSTLSGASGATFNVSGGSTSVTYSGSITQANNAAMVSIAGGHNGTISFDTNALSATNGTGLQFNNADGTYNFHTATGSTTLNGGDAGIDITNGSGGSFTFGKNGTPASFVINKSGAGNAFDVDGSVSAVTAGVTYNGNITQSNTGAMVNVNTHSTGTITFQGGTLSATSGTGLQFGNADGTYNFTGTTTLNGGDAGIDILNGSAGTFGFGGTSITNPTGVALNVDGTAAAITGGITISGAISKTSSGKLIDFFNYDTGTATISGNLSCTTSCQGVEVTNNGSAGTVNFSGGTKTLTTGASTAVNLDTNTGGTVNFTGGGLAIATTSGVGFNAIGGGTVNVTTGGNNNTIDTDTGTAVNIVTPTNIGGSGVTFKSINVDNGALNSATNAIVLNGTTGAFTVSGDGSTGSGMCGGGTNATAGLLDCDGSGGTINKTTGISVLLTSATNVTLRQMNITSPALDGIKANGGSSLTFSAIFVNTPGASNPGAGGDGFGTGNGIRAENVTGTTLIDNNTRVTNWQALVSNAVLLHNVGTNFTSFTFQDSKIDTSATGSAGFNANLNTATTGTVNLIHNEFTLIDQNAVQILNNGSGTVTSIVQKNNFHDADNTGGDGNNTFFLALAGSGQNNFTIGGPNAADGNTFKNLARLITLAGVLQIDCAGVNTGGARLNGSIQNNNLSNDVGFVNGRRAIDIQLEADAGASQGAHSVLIANNTINNNDKQGINMTLVTTGGGDIQNGNYTIKNNTLTNVGTEGNVDSGSGIEIESNADLANVGSNVSGNFLIQSNSVQNNNSSATGTTLEINNRPFGGNNTSVFNLTILGNTLTNSNASGEVFEIVNSSGDGSALPNTCLDLNSGNTSPNNAVGGNGTGFKLSANAGTFAIEGLGAATPSAFLGPKNQSNGVSPATITSVGAFVNSAGCANSTAMFVPPPAANQNLFAADFSKARIDGTAAVHTETDSSVARADLAKATVAGTATVHTEPANTRTASASFGTLISSAAHSLATFAGKVDSLVVPTASAANETAIQKPAVAGQRSDVKLNHAAGRRTAKSAKTNSALAAPPVGCSVNPGTVCVNVGTLKPGDSVQISFSVTVNNPPNLSLLTPPRVTTQGTVSGGNFASVFTNDPDTVAANDTTDTPIDLFDVKFDSLTSSLNPSTPTDPVTYTATISVDTAVQTPPVGTVPTGSITFFDNAVAIGTCTNVALSGAGPWTAQCTIAGGTYVGGSSHPITATYNGNGNFDPKTSGTLTQNVQNCGPTPVVTKIADTNDGVCDGDCSLREAIATACNNATITFDTAGVFATPQTITLTLGELPVAGNVTVDGPDAAANHVTVSGNNLSRSFNINPGKTATIRDLTITGGSAVNGAGILNDHATLTLINMTISGNTAGQGAGVYNAGDTTGTASLTITNSTISGNTATTNGGAILNDGTTGGAAVLVLNNSTISGNHANGQGGGIFVTGSSASTTVTTTNATITNNTADFDDSSASDNGGGLFIVGSAVVTLRNTIVGGNFRGTASPVADDIQGANVDTSAASLNNLIGTGGSGGLVNGSFGNQVGIAFLGLVSLNNNGGPTQTHALLLTSPAVEAGDNTTATNAGLTTDQRGTGYPRIADSADPDTTATVDIGAFELHPSIENITDKTTAEDTPINFDFNIGDGTGALITSVTASSNNPSLVTNANLAITGAGSTRTLTITPVADANTPTDGTATITVTVTATNGAIQQDDFVLTVTEVNDAPAPVNDTVSDIDEDSGVYSIPIAPIVLNDAKGPANENTQTLTVTGVSSPVGGTVVINGLNFDFTPTADFSGAAGFDYTVQDNGTTNGVNEFKSANGHVSFNINPINDAPSFTKGADQTVNEDAGAQTVNGWATAISKGAANESAQTLTFNVSVTGTTGSLAFSSAPAIDGTTGNLTYQTSPDTNGTANISVTLSDNGSNVPPNSNTSGAQTFTITVNAVNDAPSFQIPSNPPAVNEDAGAQTVNSFATSFQPGPVTATDETGQTLVGYTLSLTGSTGGLTFSSGPAIDNTGTLTYTPTADASGTATYNAVATDSGSGTAPNVNQSAPISFTITVNAQNDNPTLTTNAGLTVINGGTGTIDNTKLKVDDIDNTAAQLVFTIGTAPVNGILKKGVAVLSGGSTFTQDDINNNQITYQHTNLAAISDSFTFTVSDGAGGSIGLTTFNITTGCGNNITVTSNADSGNGTLRQAIAGICDGGTITFDMGTVISPITLTTGELVIDKSVTIQGPTTASLTISGNLASRVFSIDPGKTVSISSLTISNGRAAFGGGIYNQGTLTITASTINGNASANGVDNGGAANGTNGGDGGGLYNTGTLNVINSTISGNQAGNGGNATGTGLGGNGGNGGGIYNSGTLLLINDSISENRAGRNGLRTSGDESNVDLGTPGQGGGVFTTTTTAILRNTIIAGNLSTFFSHTDGVGGTSVQDNNNDGGGTVDNSSSFNLIGALDGLLGITAGTNGNQGGSSDSPLNPLFGPLANNGGPTSTYLPQQFSPAIDAGSNALATDQSNVALTTDQRGAGFPRILNGTVDIGSVETTPPPPPPPSADLGVTKLASADESLANSDIVYTITVTNGGPDPAVNAVLNDPLPGDMTFVSLPPVSGWTCTTPTVGTNGAINCTNPSVAAGATSVFTLTGHIPTGSPAGTFYFNTATVSSATTDPNSINNSYPAGTTVVTCVTNPVVTSNANSGAGSLRQAIIDACDGSTITFDMSQVVSPITLTSGELLINKNLTIVGPGANLLTISGNNASRIFNIQAGKTADISGLTLTNGNSASDGGAVVNQGTLTLTNSVVSNSSSTGSGGGIVNVAGNTLTITGSTISGNTAPNGAGIANAGTLIILNSTIAANTGSGLNSPGTSTITNCTISGNTAQGIDGTGTVNIGNSIVAKAQSNNVDVVGAFNSQGNNLIGDKGSSTGFTNGVNGDQVGTSGALVNPLLSALAGNGGPTQTMALLPGSPAINAGNNTLANNAALTTDQRGAGFNRIVNTTVDIGAFESRGFTISATSGTPQNTTISTAFGAPLVATVSSPFGEPVNGGQVTFTAPGAGASATFTGGVTTIIMTTNASGQASASVTANGTAGGPYNVTAGGNGITGTASFSLTNDKANQTINFGAIVNKTFGDADFVVSPTATSGLPVSLAASGNCTVTSPSPGTVHITGAGSCTITASQAGDSNYNPAANVPQSFTIAKANQTITFGAIATKTFGDPDFVVSPTTTSGLPVSLVASGNCTVTSPAPGTVHITGAGSCTITASQAGDANYNAATDVPQSFTINKANQTITFAALTTKTFGDPDFVISPTASSGLPVSLAASGNCTVSTPSPGTVHITGAGSCTITASQAGDANYNAAPNVPQSFTINKANQTITFNALPNKTFGDPDFAVVATASSALPVSFAASGNCTVTSPSQGTIHLTGAGSCTITASQAGDANYNPATDVPRSFTIAKAATVTSVSSNFNPSDLNQNVTFRAEVSSVAAKTGTVQFKDNGNNLGAPVTLDSLGVALFSTSSLTAGTHTITAEYSGDANFLASTGTLSGGQVVRPQPSLSINDVSVTEGDVGTKVLTFTITLSAGSNLPVSVDYATANGTATAGSDYVATNGTFTFNPLDGDVTRTVNVTINGDIGFEPDETFTVNLSNPVNATISDNQGIGTIQNDDVLGGLISFSQANTSVNEIAGIVTLTVVRTNDVSQAVNVDYATDDTGSSTNCAALNTGLASQRCDYTSVFGTLRFAANETQKTIDVPINLDAYTEGPETFTVKLSNPTGGAVLAVPSTGIVTINDSASPTPNAIDDTTNFVRQQYRDFLNRDADAAGLAFWKDNIDKCNDPARRPPGQTVAQCIELQRIVTSAAFFLSIEFKQTGGMVREFYVAALDRPASNNMPTFVEFMRDAQAIQKGVVVGQGNWQAVLDANRTAFMNEFVMRAEFVALYPTTDTPTQYVDKLYQHAAVAPVTVQERLDAIQEFGGAPTAADPGARGRALLRITQNGNFQAREANRTFVQIEYFGYLRRDPDLAGYNFWVAKLNQFNGNFLDAEMVKAFLSSLEYRGRFGP